MLIKVMSKKQIEELVPDRLCAIISITNTYDEIVSIKYSNYIKDILRLTFLDEDDVSYQKKKNDKYRLFNTADALRILNFVDSLKDRIEVLYIHCNAGFSRSPAVAAALCDIYNIESNINWFFNYSPNIFVYRKLLNTYHFRDEIKE